MFPCPACRERTITTRHKMAGKGPCPACGARIMPSFTGFSLMPMVALAVLWLVASFTPVRSGWGVGLAILGASALSVPFYLYLTPLRVAGSRAGRIDIAVGVALFAIGMAACAWWTELH